MLGPVTLPLPAPARVMVSVKLVREKLTETVLSSPWTSVRKQSVAVLAAAGERVELQPGFAFGVSRIAIELEPGGMAYVSEQSEPQLIPAGVLVTVPPGCADDRQPGRRGNLVGASLPASPAAAPRRARGAGRENQPRNPSNRPIALTLIDTPPVR